MNKLLSMLHRLQHKEQELAAAFYEMARRHSAEYDITRCILFAGWSKAHVAKLEKLRKQFGASSTTQPVFADDSVLQPKQENGLGLLLDIEQLLSLAHHTHVAWISVSQAAKTLKNEELNSCVLSCSSDLQRAISWLQTQLNNSAPQAILYG